MWWSMKNLNAKFFKSYGVLNFLYNIRLFCKKWSFTIVSVRLDWNSSFVDKETKMNSILNNSLIRFCLSNKVGVGKNYQLFFHGLQGFLCILDLILRAKQFTKKVILYKGWHIGRYFYKMFKIKHQKLKQQCGLRMI